MSKGRVTMDQLATMVANGFHTLQEELHAFQEETRSGFIRIEHELKDHRTRLRRIERKLDSTIERVDDHDVRLQRLETSRDS